MTKQELLNRIEEAIVLEEDAYSVYAEHLHAALEWADLSEGDKNQASSILNTLKVETEGHSKTLRAIKDYIMKENCDVF